MRAWPIAAVLFAVAQACISQVQAAGTLRFGLDFDFDTFDPARSGSDIERVVNTAMCDQLLDVDPQLNLVPQLPTSWEWSADQLALRRDLHHGQVITGSTAMSSNRG